MKHIIILITILLISISVNAQKKTKKEKKFVKAHKALVKECLREDKSIKTYYKCHSIRNNERQLKCYTKQNKEITDNLKWFDKKERKLIKKFGDGVSVFVYKN